MGAIIQHASASKAFEQRLRNAVPDAEGITIVSSPDTLGSGTPDQVAASLAATRPDLVVLGPDTDLEMALLVAEQLDSRHPEISVVLVTVPTSHVLERAIHVGTRGVLAPDADDVEIHSVITKAISVAQRRRDFAAAIQPETPTSRIIPVLSAKGGSGKTTVASNLAVSIAREEPGNVLLIDLDLQFGDVASAFGVDPAHTFADLGSPGESIDMTRTKAILTPKQAASLYILAAPDTPAEADDLDPRRIAQTIKLLSTEFPYIVVDTPAGIDEFTLEVLDLATDLVLVASMDVPSVRALSKSIDALHMLRLNQAQWHLVLNRASAKVGISVDDIEANLGVPIDVRVPSTRNIPLSVNRGTPLALTSPRSPAGRAFEELARRTTNADQASTSRWRRKS